MAELDDVIGDDPGGLLGSFVGALRNKYRELTGEDEPPTLREMAQRRAMTLPQNLMAQPDAMAAYQVPPPPPPPTPVLEAEGRQPLSDQARRLGNLQDAERGRVPEISGQTRAQALMESPGYSRARTGIELAADFSGAGIAKDALAAGISAAQGNLGEAAGYSLATIPFLGRAKDMKGIMQAMRPYHPTGVSRNIVSEMADPTNAREHFIFAPTYYHNQASFPQFTDIPSSRHARDPLNPTAKQRRIALAHQQGDQLAEMPALGLAPTVPAHRVEAMKDLGLIGGRESLAINAHLADTYDDLLQSGVLSPADARTHQGLGVVVDASNLDPRIKEVLDPANPLFPGTISLHEGRNRSQFLDYLYNEAGVPFKERLTPLRFRVSDEAPLDLLDTGIAFRQPLPYANKKFQLLDAPLHTSRFPEQATVAERVRWGYGSERGEDVAAWNAMFNDAAPLADFSDNVKLRALPGGQEAMDAADRSMLYMKKFMEEIENKGLTISDPSDLDVFTDYLSRTLMDAPYDPARGVKEGFAGNIDLRGIAAAGGLGRDPRLVGSKSWHPTSGAWAGKNRHVQQMDNSWASTFPELW